MHVPVPLPALNKRISVERNGQRLSITPTVPKLARTLRTITGRAVADPEHGYRLGPQSESLLVPPVCSPNAGLEQIVWYLLKERGYTIESRQYGPRGLGTPQIAEISQIGAVDVQMLDFVRHQPSGLIRFDNQLVNRAWLIEQITTAFPATTVAVATDSVERGQQLTHQLRERIPDVTYATASSCPEDVGRVVVSTFYGLANYGIEVEKRDIVIVLDAIEGFGVRGQLALLSAERARLFGFVPTGAKIAPYDRDRLVRMFGLDEVVVPRHGHIMRRVETLVLPIAGGPRLADELQGVELKRRGVWQHPVRNRRLARYARDMVSRPSNAAGTDTGRYAASVHAPKLAVVVENVEHAVELAPLLPDWTVVTGSDVELEGLSRAQIELLRSRALQWDPGQRFVVTLAGIERVNLHQADVVIWAAAGRHMPPIPPAALVSRGCDARRLLVVDFFDLYHQQLAQWSRQRQAEYNNAGWYAAGVNRDAERVRRFLASRPKGGQ